MAAPTTTGRRTVRPTSRIAVPGISRIAGMAPATGRTVRPDLTADRMAPALVITAPAPDRITVRRTGRRIVRCITARITASPA